MRLVSLMVAGAIAGLIAWAIAEPYAPETLRNTTENHILWQSFSKKFALLAGLSIGLAIGGVSGWLQGSRAHAIRGFMLGGLIGAFAGMVGLSLGEIVFEPMKGIPIIGRAIGWAVFGSILGLADGIGRRSARRIWLGAVGGAIGGLVGGVLFELSGVVVGLFHAAMPNLSRNPLEMIQQKEIGTVPRAIGLASIGAGIGLFTEIVQAAGRRAWLRLILGRNEYKEWTVDAAQTVIGRSEFAHVPLSGDPNIMPNHAIIQRNQNSFVLIDGGSPLGTGLNGQRINQVQLTSGDTIQVGHYQLVFLQKSGQGSRSAVFAPPPIQTRQIATENAPFSAHQQVPTAPPQSPPQQLPPWSIVAISGPLTGRRFDLTKPVELGREAQDISLAFDSMASRKHARFDCLGTSIEVTDLGSKNGTIVNGQKITRQLINRGDIIQIGSTSFRVE